MVARGLAVAAFMVGAAGTAVFFAYVLGTGMGFWPRGESVHALPAIAINFGLLTIFALQHSGMARQSFNRLLGVPARSVYVAASGIALGALALGWQPLPGEPIWHGPTWIVAISALAAAASAGCCWWYNPLPFFGLTQVWTGQAEIPGKLRTDGPNRYVRHPLLLALLISLWAQPIMPPELLALNLGMTLYVLVGIRLEECDLVRAFGAEYEAYRKTTPMLVPWRWW